MNEDLYVTWRHVSELPERAMVIPVADWTDGEWAKERIRAHHSRYPCLRCRKIANATSVTYGDNGNIVTRTRTREQIMGTLGF